MFEPGMKMFQVRLTRHDEDVGVFVLPAFDTRDALARAKASAAATEAQGCINPFNDIKGVEAFVTPLS